MRGPLAGAFFLIVLQISACAAQPSVGSIAAAAQRPPTAAPTNAATSAASQTKKPNVTGQAKAGESTAWFRNIQPARALAKVQTKVTRTVIPHKVRTSASPSPTHLAPSRPLTVSTAVAPRVTTYNSLNAGGIAAGDTIQASPPDSTGAIGPNYYVEIVNSEIAVRSRTDLSTVATTSLSDFVGAPNTVVFCDPQMQWDPSSTRWLVSFIFCNAQAGTGSQVLVVGWSQTSDPRGNNASGWCLFTVGTGNNFFDYAKLGHNSKYMILGGNFYDDSTLSFEGSSLAWVGKPASGSTSCALPSIDGTNTTLMNGDGFTPTFTPVPVNTNSAASDGYIVSAYDPAGNVGAVASQRKLAIWHLDSAGVLHAHPDIGVNLYSLPVAASQLGGSWAIDTLDGRLTQAVGNPATGIWTSHTVDDGALSSTPSVVRWYEIKVSGTTASLVQQGNVSSATDWIFNGAISPRQDAQGAMIEYSRSSATIDPVIAAQVRLSSTPVGTMEPGEMLLDSSGGADQDFSCGSGGQPCRWGDYSGLTPDPTNTNVVWGTNEVLDAPSTNLPEWHDRNFALIYVASPTSLGGQGGNQSAFVSWTPGPPDPNTPVTSYTIGVYDGSTETKTVAAAASASNVLVTGLINGTAYTFTIITNVAGGSSLESTHTGPVTPTRAANPVSTPPAPIRDQPTQTSPAPPPSR